MTTRSPAHPDLSGQVALVTGAGRGIGAAIAVALARCGATVVCSARSADEVERTAQACHAAGGRGVARTCDVGDEVQVASLFAGIASELGALDVMIVNAGLGAFGALRDIDLKDLDALYRVNVRGAFACVRGALKMMLPVKKGTIITMASVVAARGYPNQGAYTATKHALYGMTKSLAAEVAADGLRVACLLPGAVDTEMVRAARPDLDPTTVLAPQDLAEAVLYLLSLPDRAWVDELHLRRRGAAPFAT